MIEIAIALFIVIFLYIMFKLNIETFRYTLNIFNKPKTLNISIKIEDDKAHLLEISDKSMIINYSFDKQNNTFNFSLPSKQNSYSIKLYEFKDNERRYEGFVDQDLSFLQTLSDKGIIYLDIQLLV